MTDDTLARGRRLLEALAPDMEAVLDARYGHLLPTMAHDLVGFVYGAHYGDDAVDMRSRQIATIAALTALGSQTAPQLRVHIEIGRRVGLGREEIARIIWQMALYGGFPAAINGLNVALAVFAAEDEDKATTQ
jgi:4-carboxymuconolactone decarboxylase